MLLLFRGILQRGETEAEPQRFQDMHDKLLHGLSQEAVSGLQARLPAIPKLLQGILNVARSKLTRTVRIIAFIEQTPAPSPMRETIIAILRAG